MAAKALDGTAVAARIRAEVAPDVSAFTARAGRPPGLGIVLVGDNPASEIYVRNKIKSAGETGLHAELFRLPATASLEDVLALVQRLNDSDAHDGILVQSPLPEALGPEAERRVFDAVDSRKDVDGLHPLNVGRLVQGRAALAACTPSGIIELLERSGVAIAGARAVVIGRSDIVGKPMAMLLLNRHATVTICHSKTANLPEVASQGDILVAAIGRAGFVTKAFVKPGAAVVDVGTTQLTDREAIGKLYPPGSKRWETFERRGSLVVGDVHPEVADVAGWLSPVPGGVGPLTIAMLLKNTVTAARRRAGWAG